jgi:hypothetical protein
MPYDFCFFFGRWGQTILFIPLFFQNLKKIIWKMGVFIGDGSAGWRHLATKDAMPQVPSKFCCKTGLHQKLQSGG